VRADLPTGTVTFLFSDVEGSTRLLQQVGAEAYARALAEHRRLLRQVFARHQGVEVDTQGDAFFYAFPTAPGALAAARGAQEALARGPIRVRIGLHTGTPHLTDEGYAGADVHRAARIAAAGHGGQVLVSAATASLVGVDDLRDLGEHRLKDLSAPERIYQLGRGDFPPLATLYQTNLPVPSTPFLGRERELAEVLGLLSRDEVRLLTLTGPGGSGKTRLAAQTAGLAAGAYPEGTWWVPLAALRDPKLVLESAARALGARNGLAEHVADKRLLLLFDNFEHLLGAAADVAGLIAACPNLDLLVTSREPLHVSGEQEYPVPPLAPEEGVGFFLARARAVKPDFRPDAAVAEICRRLDDLPLALELGAARVKALSPQQILERLERRLPLLTGGARDLPERQRTLRAAIEWSYDLLSPAEQRLFARLSVFRGGCTLEAAEEICEVDLDLLHSLVDKSLLRHREERYAMLETIQEYAAEKLEESGEAAQLGRRHAEWFLELAEEAEPHLRGSPKEWLDRLEREHDNIRAALDRLVTACEGEAAQRLTGALWRFWSMRGYPAEAKRQLERALAADRRPTAARGKALNGATVMALETGDYATARLRAEQALALSRTIGDAWGTAVSTQLLGNVRADERDYEAARELFEEALERFTDLGEEHYVLLAMRLVAWMHFELGNLPRARALHEEVVRRAQAAGNQRMQATSLGALGEYALEEGRIQEALPLLAESARICRGLDERPELMVQLWRLARLLTLVGRTADGTQVFAAAEALREEMGASPYRWMEALNADTLARIRDQLDEATFAAAWEEGRKLTLDEAVELALGAAEGD